MAVSCLTSLVFPIRAALVLSRRSQSFLFLFRRASCNHVSSWHDPLRSWLRPWNPCFRPRPRIRTVRLSSAAPLSLEHLHHRTKPRRAVSSPTSSASFRAILPCLLFSIDFTSLSSALSLSITLLPIRDLSSNAPASRLTVTCMVPGFHFTFTVWFIYYRVAR